MPWPKWPRNCTCYRPSVCRRQRYQPQRARLELRLSANVQSKQPPSAPTFQSADFEICSEDPAVVTNDWAAMVSTPNRLCALSSVEEVGNNRSSQLNRDLRSGQGILRVRRRPPPLSEVNNNVNINNERPVESNQRRRVATVAGKSSRTGLAIAAANKIRKKAVFCVDNLSTSCTVDDIRRFVSGLSVEVISCFDTNP